VSDPSWLKLLSKIVGHHRQDNDGKSVLVPCFHQVLEKDVELLAAGARRSGGTLFDLDADEGWEPPPGPVLDDRVSLLDGVFEPYLGGAIPSRVTFQLDEDQRVIAELEEHAEAPEPSLRLILRAAAVIASSAYDQFDLVIVALTVASTDPDRRELLWRMLTLDPVDLQISGSATTIVPILGADLQPDSDYRRRPEVRYVALSDRLVERPPLFRARAIERLGDVGDRPLVLFLGAGASASARIRLGNAYRDIALRDYVGERYSDAPEHAFFDLIQEQSRFLAGEPTTRAEFIEGLTLERVLRETFADLGDRPRADCRVIQELTADCERALGYVRAGRRALRELAANLTGRLILITVNFDRLIEDDLGVSCNVMYTPEHFETHLEDLRAYVAGDASRPLPVMKLHGSIEDPDSLIATLDATAAGLDDRVRNALNVIVETAEQPVRWAWVGCSMRDRDVTAWLDGMSATALDDWWVDPFPGQPLEEFFDHHRALRWPADRTLANRLIVDSADGFLRALADVVTG
jgi:hypothetical protein